MRWDRDLLSLFGFMNIRKEYILSLSIFRHNDCSKIQHQIMEASVCIRIKEKTAISFRLSLKIVESVSTYNTYFLPIHPIQGHNPPLRVANNQPQRISNKTALPTESKNP